MSPLGWLLLAAVATCADMRSAGQIRHDEAVAAVARGALPYYPDNAQGRGRVVLDCVVEEGGWLNDCRVASETPPGEAFGATALKMAPLFNVGPAIAATADKKGAVEHPPGSRIQFQIAFDDEPWPPESPTR